MDDVVLCADFGGHLQRGLQHLHVTGQPPGLVHEVDRQRTVDRIDHVAVGAGLLERFHLRTADPAADHDIHVVGGQLDRFHAERLDHVQFVGEVAEIVGSFVGRDARTDNAVGKHV